VGGGDLPQAADDRAHGDPGLTGPRARGRRSGPARGGSLGRVQAHYRERAGRVGLVFAQVGPVVHEGRVQPVPFGAVP
jgi:hypothetical protein